MQKFLIVTADDFGLHDSINEAVEVASHYGVLTAASLMVAAPAATDAVQRAKRLPSLRVGLHLVLADGRPMLPPEQIPALVNREGRLGSSMAYDGLRYFLSAQARAQLEAEIRAQFEAYAATGLPLDHINTHKHFHLHPTIMQIVLRVAQEYGSPPVRATVEPIWFGFRSGLVAGVSGLLLTPWTWLLRQQLRRAQVPHNDFIFGIAASGRMDEEALLHVISRLPTGVTEIYLHPATASRSAITPSMETYRHSDELAALLSSRVCVAILASGATQGGFRDIEA